MELKCVTGGWRFWKVTLVSSQGERAWSGLHTGDQLEEVRRAEHHLRSWTNDESPVMLRPPLLVKPRGQSFRV